jgi:Cu(I)/Ag(I) efflux system protein CusF
MKHLALVLAVSLLAGCNQAPEPAAPSAQAPAPAAASTPPPATPAPAPAEVKRASASGTVQSIDAAAKTITIAHGPVDALGWPGMTMSFQAPNTDLAAFKAGDNVDFEFDSTGMDGTIVSITRK